MTALVLEVRAMATMGRYPASGGWERLIPEKLTAVQVPKPKPPVGKSSAK